jgi:hypothetical protein
VLQPGFGKAKSDRYVFRMSELIPAAMVRVRRRRAGQFRYLELGAAVLGSRRMATHNGSTASDALSTELLHNPPIPD